MKKEIVIYEKDREILKLLRSFFQDRHDYSVHFVKKGENLKKLLLKKKPAALIVSSPEGLELTKSSDVKCPIIATITPANITDGIRKVIKSNVEYYLLSPFCKEDLTHKLRLAIERKNWFENLFKERKDIEFLMELTYLLTSTLRPKEVLDIIVKKISEVIKIPRCSIISVDVEDQRYAYVISTSDNPEITNLKLDLRKYPEIKKAVSIRMPVIIKDALKDPSMKDVKTIIMPLGIRSILVIPIIFHNEIMGTLLLRTAKKYHSFTEREIKLCIAVANTSANPLYNAFLHDRFARENKMLEKLAVTDYLTGIYNIRYFYRRLEEEFSRAKRYQIQLCCMMLDIDNFKKINDTYGHKIGDIVLREFAQLVRGLSRQSDVFARYGGEEFIMLLPQTSLKGAVTEAERIRKAVSDHQFMGLEKKERITVSIGIAIGPHEKVKTSDDLIALADDALFAAKKSGRDQIILYPLEGIDKQDTPLAYTSVPFQKVANEK